MKTLSSIMFIAYSLLLYMLLSKEETKQLITPEKEAFTYVNIEEDTTLNNKQRSYYDYLYEHTK
jgi:dTDP-4-dehydrorhamnose 3,5-epimerase-like enzyme